MHTYHRYAAWMLTGVMLAGRISPALAQEKDTGAREPDGADLAHQVQNPVANLTSVPLQNNFDFGLGAEDAFRYTLNVQPVIPFSLSRDWNLISRTILPIIYQGETVAGEGDHGGLGDLLQSLFFVPAGLDPLTFGFGPAVSLPTATSDTTGTEKWAVGPTAIALVQPQPWTLGILANHVWSFAGDDARSDVNSTFLQPFVSYTLPTALAFNANMEATHDWEADSWSVPLILGASQVFQVADQHASAAIFGKYWIAGPDAGPDWGLRFALTLLFPKG